MNWLKTNEFVVWVQSPVAGVYRIDQYDDLVTFMIHPDGAGLPLTEDQVRAFFEEPNSWKKDADGRDYSCSIALGFSSVFVFRLDVTPTTFISRCYWCGERHLGKCGSKTGT